jgi:uncharacterized Rossmann fold enzyme
MNKLFYAVVVLIILVMGMFFGAVVMGSLAKSNNITGYHCAPIVKVKTLEEAKAIIEAHQKRIGSIK